MVRELAPNVVRAQKSLSQGHHKGYAGQGGEAPGDDEEGDIGPDFGPGEF